MTHEKDIDVCTRPYNLCESVTCVMRDTTVCEKELDVQLLVEYVYSDSQVKVQASVSNLYRVLVGYMLHNAVNSPLSSGGISLTPHKFITV